MKTPYGDIIHLPHHVSQNHPQMPMLDRAAQFAPFAALTGYEAAVGETARLTAERRELDPQEAAELNRRLAAIITRLPDRLEATIEYFVPDDRKAGGAYVTVTGRVRHISVPEKTLVMEDGTVIPQDDIVSAAGEIFCRIEDANGGRDRSRPPDGAFRLTCRGGKPVPGNRCAGSPRPARRPVQ